jgi:hypothetical protein
MPSFREFPASDPPPPETGLHRFRRNFTTGETPMPSALIQSDVEIFEKSFQDAIGYHMRALQFVDEKQRASLVFNVASVAVENYLLAICSYHGVMPFNHNYNYLMNAAESAITFDTDLAASIRSLDEIFGICSLDEYHHGAPEQPDAEKVLKICEDLRQIIYQLDIKPLADTNKEGAI